MHATLVKEGQTLEVTPAAAVAAGNIVITNTVAGVAQTNVAASAAGTIQIEGVFDITKNTSVFVFGDPVYWDATNEVASNMASAGHYLGVAVATNTATLVRTALNLQSTKAPRRIKAATVAAAGAAQGNAAALVEGFNLVSGADDAAGVILPAPQMGSTVIIKSLVGDHNLLVYPHVGGNINAGTANEAINQTNNAARTYWALNTTNWYTSPSPEV
jgi:predicted RecA/RadA family phage recombinase